MTSCSSAGACTPKGEKRRLAVIDAAYELFLEHGFENTTLDMIIERAGGSRRTIYSNFGGKDGLLMAIIDNHCQKISEQMFDAPLSGRPVEEVLNSVGKNFLRYLITSQGASYFRLMVKEVSRLPELGKRFLESGPFSCYRILGSYLDEERRAGRIWLENPELRAAQFLEAVKGDLLFRLLFEPDFDPSGIDVDKYVQEVVEIFMRGSRPGPGIGNTERS